MQHKFSVKNKLVGLQSGIFSLCLVASSITHAQMIKIDGSSTVYPISEAVAEEFQNTEQGKTKVVVGISGTGGGFKKFCRGETDISDASRPILKAEMETCKKNGIRYIELPIAFDAIVVVVPKSTSFINEISIEDLKKIWEPSAQGKITNWHQVRADLPNTELKLYGPGTDSGTFDYFTDAAVGKEKASRGDYTASADPNVLVQGVSRDKAALGYFGYAYYVENANKLKALAIKINEKSKAVLPSENSVIDGSYKPLSRPIMIYINQKSLEKPEVERFVQFYLKNAAKLSKEVKYIPLSTQDYAHTLENFNKRKLGTAFGGEPKIGVRIADLLKMEPKE